MDRKYNISKQIMWKELHKQIQLLYIEITCVEFCTISIYFDSLHALALKYVIKIRCLTVFLFEVKVVADEGLYLFLKSATILDNFSRSESL